MQDPWNHIEYAKAEMPDGRLLLIERERAPRLSRNCQVALYMGILIIAVLCRALVRRAACSGLGRARPPCEHQGRGVGGVPSGRS